jgi:hypothetical protein
MKVLAEKRKEVIMNAIDHRQGIEKKIGVWKAKMHGLSERSNALDIKKEKKFSTFRTGACLSVKCPLLSYTSITSAQLRGLHR